MKSRILTVAALALLALVACNDATEPASPLQVATVEVSPAGGNVKVQQTLQLRAVAKSAAGDELPEKTITWSSGNQARATVSATGLVTGVAAGFVAITASSDGRHRAVPVEVTEQPAPPPPPPPPPVGNPVPEIESLSPSSVKVGTYRETIVVRGKNFIAGSVGMWNGGSRSTDFVSSTEVHVTLEGEDMAIIGSGRIRVFNPAPGGGMSNELQVTIEPRSQLVITPGALDLVVGDTARLRATIYDSWGTPLPPSTSIRVHWLRLDGGPLFESYDAVRDSIRVRVNAPGTFRVIARHISGLLADTIVVTAR